MPAIDFTGLAEVTALEVVSQHSAPRNRQRPRHQQCLLRVADLPRGAAGGGRELEDLPGPGWHHIPVSSASEQDWQTDDWSRGSGDVPSGDYELWVRLANDPSQSEQARQQYRERMAEYVHQKMRAAFRFATQQTLNSPADGKSATHCAGAGATDQE
jgi:hypothetical protein